MGKITAEEHGAFAVIEAFENYVADRDLVYKGGNNLFSRGASREFGENRTVVLSDDSKVFSSVIKTEYTHEEAIEAGLELYGYLGN